MNTLTTNIDPMRAEIMRLENAEAFDQAAWARVLVSLEGQGRAAGLSDALRRMAAARINQATQQTERLIPKREVDMAQIIADFDFITRRQRA